MKKHLRARGKAEESHDSPHQPGDHHAFDLQRIDHQARDHRDEGMANGIQEAHRLFKALGHETRYAIVQLLIERKLFCGDLVAELGLPQSTVSHHLKILRDAGIVKTETRGQWVCYVLKSEVIKTTLRRFIESLPSIDVLAGNDHEENHRM